MAQTHRGKATYYAKKLNGARTASGRRLDNNKLQCAHRTYPFGTMLRVKNLTNGKEVVVEVIDRGPFGRGLIIDLTTRAAKEIDMIRQGVVMVEVEPVERRPPYRLEKTEVGIPQIELEPSDYSMLPTVDLLNKSVSDDGKTVK